MTHVLLKHAFTLFASEGSSMPSSAKNCPPDNGMTNVGFHYGNQAAVDFNGAAPMVLPPLEAKDFSSQPAVHDTRYGEDCAVQFREFSCMEENPFSISIPPRKTYDHVQDKELRKKLKNRESAQAARDRKKAKMMFLERQVSDLVKRNRFLETENMELRKMVHIAESQPHWRTKTQIGQIQNGNPFPTSRQEQPDTQDHYFQQTSSLQTVCTYSTNISEMSMNLPNGNNDAMEKIAQESNRVSAASLSRKIHPKDENFPTGDEVFRRDVMFLTDNAYAPDQNYVGNSSSQVSDTIFPPKCHQKATRDIHTEDWMLSLTTDAPTGTSGLTSEQNTSKQPGECKEICEDSLLSTHMSHIPCQGLEYPWAGIPSLPGNEFPRTCTSENTNNQVQDRTRSYGYGENSYCDSSGVESMSSPDMSAGSAVSSPDIVDRLGQDFFSDKPPFKVH